MRVYFEGRHDLTTLDETGIAELGVGRKFQKPTVFENHTVADNILLAARTAAVFATLFSGAAPAGAGNDRAHPVDDHGCGEERGRLAGSLSHGQKQWLEIGMLLAQDPKLLLVDEPVAGMTDSETAKTAELLKRIAAIIPSSWWSMTWRSSVNSASRSPCCTRDRC